MTERGSRERDGVEDGESRASRGTRPTKIQVAWPRHARDTMLRVFVVQH